MDSLIKLQRRKAELKAKIEQQRSDLKKTFLEVREEIEPANLLKKAVSGVFRSSKNEQNKAQAGTFKQLPAPIAFMADLLIKDPRMALLVKVLAPLAMKFFPKRVKDKTSEESSKETPIIGQKAKIYGGLRRSIISLRNRLKKAEKAEGNVVETTPEPTEI